MEQEAANTRKRDDDAARVHLAWQTASFAMMAFAGKLQPLDQVLEAAKPAQAVTQTPQQFRAMARMMAASYGHPFTKRVH